MKTHLNQDSENRLPTKHDFRTWCREKWYEHVEESITWNGYEPTATPKEYFNKYAYWLKREYKHQRQNND